MHGEVASGVAEEGHRAATYRLLATLLARPPSAETLELVRTLPAAAGDAQSPLAQAWQLLRLAAEHASVDALDDEFHNLFIGIARGELLPYGSWYLTGFVMDRPLALLRRDLQALGIERQQDVYEPEDHAAALCEVMGILVENADGDVPFPLQRQFFDEHIAPWMGRFFSDLQQAESARFYRAVGRLGEQFIEFEKRYMTLEP